SRSHIANFLRLTRLPERIQQSLVEEALTMGQAKPLLSLEREDLIQKAADYIIDHNLSTREAEAFVARVQKDPNFFEPKQLKDPVATERAFVTDVEDRLKLVFGSPVRIVLGQRKSKIEISFKSQEDLDRVVEALTRQHEENVELTKKKLREVSTTFSV
ncbi:MAG: chromosome partitioning protein ParB, partial [Schwartzia sp.]|nr:chromosome partitioning protein ParB [Schwartzia sp. (in: firmicutes)]